MRRFIYQYNGNDRGQDVEEDLTGRIETPTVGSIVSRNGHEWRVLRVVAPVRANGTVPVVRIFLTDGGKWRNAAPKPAK